MIKALDYHGKIILSREPISIDEAWFIAKNIRNATNSDEKTIKQYASLWRTKQTYRCSYPQNIEMQLGNMARCIEINSCTNQASYSNGSTEQQVQR